MDCLGTSALDGPVVFMMLVLFPIPNYTVKYVSNGELLQDEELRVTDGTIPIFLIGDSAYPLLPWLLKPFSYSPSLPRHHKNYNY